ncbi:hypothetical protein HPB50_024146 [Hyalomma asiaticum]|uniref:Uncharacterized protein n=1 Tax=Hyalomma asiaticum TaxID=266040 RepID=A0ACB7TMX2_HYAAI|nr:hypothetical protein HPB50_024146 [Hyalomma asiaticum]
METSLSRSRRAPYRIGLACQVHKAAKMATVKSASIGQTARYTAEGGSALETISAAANDKAAKWACVSFFSPRRRGLCTRPSRTPRTHISPFQGLRDRTQYERGEQRVPYSSTLFRTWTQYERGEQRVHTVPDLQVWNSVELYELYGDPELYGTACDQRCKVPGCECAAASSSAAAGGEWTAVLQSSHAAASGRTPSLAPFPREAPPCVPIEASLKTAPRAAEVRDTASCPDTCQASTRF